MGKNTCTCRRFLSRMSWTNHSEKPGFSSWDRVFCHEITTPIAINDLVERGMDTVFDPDKIKAVIDHVTPAKDSKTAEQGRVLRKWALNGIK